jgi:hypothetical protein
MLGPHAKLLCIVTVALYVHTVLYIWVLEAGGLLIGDHSHHVRVVAVNHACAVIVFVDIQP